MIITNNKNIAVTRISSDFQSRTDFQKIAGCVFMNEQLNNVKKYSNRYLIKKSDNAFSCQIHSHRSHFSLLSVQRVKQKQVRLTHKLKKVEYKIIKIVLSCLERWSFCFIVH